MSQIVASTVTMRMRAVHHQRGLGVIAAIVVLVMLASLAGAVVRLTWTQQVASSQDIMGARAFQAANAGTEWGMYKALKGTWAGSACAGSSQTLDLRSTMGFWVTVSCATQASAYREGQNDAGADNTVRLYIIDAVACTGAASCPDNTLSSSPTYIERRRQVIISSADPGF